MKKLLSFLLVLSLSLTLVLTLASCDQDDVDKYSLRELKIAGATISDIDNDDVTMNLIDKGNKVEFEIHNERIAELLGLENGKVNAGTYVKAAGKLLVTFDNNITLPFDIDDDTITFSAAGIIEFTLED